MVEMTNNWKRLSQSILLIKVRCSCHLSVSCDYMFMNFVGLLQLVNQNHNLSNLWKRHSEEKIVQACRIQKKWLNLCEHDNVITIRQ